MQLRQAKVTLLALIQKHFSTSMTVCFYCRRSLLQALCKQGKDVAYPTQEKNLLIMQLTFLQG